MTPKKKRKQVIINFKIKPLIFEINPQEVNNFLFGKKKKQK